ncbi:unnamed protein product [Lasius platythorax]|uniref:Uncharacterized protein n=1 Tax=Lasius platythorax TaxID=488582 RepID=A0AAV2PAF1_9HYME
MAILHDQVIGVISRLGSDAVRGEVDDGWKLFVESRFLREGPSLLSRNTATQRSTDGISQKHEWQDRAAVGRTISCAMIKG